MIRVENIELMYVEAGEQIGFVAERACATAADHACPVGFEFNQTFILVRPGDTKEKVLREWSAKRDSQYGGNV